MQHRMAKDPYAQTPLILDKISYDYGTRQKQGARVLDEISLECQAGTWTAIMGPSGLSLIHI